MDDYRGSGYREANPRGDGRDKNEGKSTATGKESAQNRRTSNEKPSSGMWPAWADREGKGIMEYLEM
jgi:hypothetical protein